MHTLFLQHQVVNVTNPSHLPLTVQPVLLHHYTRTQSVVHTLSEHLNSDLLHMDFSHTLSNSFSFPKEHVSFDTDTSLASTVLEPQDPYQITVAFSPKVDSVASTLLLIRNNLTVLDYVLLRGRGIQGTFSIDGVQPSSDPLMFEFTQTMMERCQGWWCVTMTVNFCQQGGGGIYPSSWQNPSLLPRYILAECKSKR